MASSYPELIEQLTEILDRGSRPTQADADDVAASLALVGVPEALCAVHHIAEHPSRNRVRLTINLYQIPSYSTLFLEAMRYIGDRAGSDATQDHNVVIDAIKAEVAAKYALDVNPKLPNPKEVKSGP